MTASALIPTAIISSVQRSDLEPRQVAKEFTALAASNQIKIAGSARGNPDALFSKGLKPRHKIELFDTIYYFSKLLQIPELRFFVVFIVQPHPASAKRKQISARIVYKDLSLSWRVASHFVEDDEIWIGKGDVRLEIIDGHEADVSNEATTDLPHEMQTAVEKLLGWSDQASSGRKALELVLKKAPVDRVEPYRDFVIPRRIAASNPKNLIYGGKLIARFSRSGDPTSLKIAAGFEPDFVNGILERGHSFSKLYGGKLLRVRVLSANQKAQYYFISGKKHTWIIPPQATTTQFSSYGVRTIDVEAEDDLFIPGYEYHHIEKTKNGEELYSQIPAGFAGEICPIDDMKADASPWLNKIPLIQEFKKKVLKKKR